MIGLAWLYGWRLLGSSSLALLGLWLTRRRGSKPESFGRSSSPSQLTSPVLEESFPGSPPDFDGWQKPTKYACRHSQKKKTNFESGDGLVTESRRLFVVLAESGAGQDMGCEGSLRPLDHYMADATGLHLKRARSPPRLAQLQVNHGLLA